MLFIPLLPWLRAFNEIRILIRRKQFQAEFSDSFQFSSVELFFCSELMDSKEIEQENRTNSMQVASTNWFMF